MRLSIGIDKKLTEYIENKIFPKYSLNDSAHDIKHIKEVIKRSFEIKKSLGLELNDKLIFTIAACHDLGKYINHDIHEKIAAEIFIKDEFFKNYFTDEERSLIKDAIEDHRSSLTSPPRGKYGELISSADRNTKIETTFKRSFEVGRKRNPDMPYDKYLIFTFERLKNRYSTDNPENMFYIDKKYIGYLKDIRKLLSDQEKFNESYNKTNNIKHEDCKKSLSQLN